MRKKNIPFSPKTALSHITQHAIFCFFHFYIYICCLSVSNDIYTRYMFIFLKNSFTLTRDHIRFIFPVKTCGGISINILVWPLSWLPQPILMLWVLFLFYKNLITQKKKKKRKREKTQQAKYIFYFSFYFGEKIGERDA